jgi:microcystin-dependent protein
MKRLLAPAALASALQVISVGAASAQTHYVGEVRLFAFNNFCPADWLPADGRLVPISDFIALFSLIGTSYGGNGVNNFGLPNLVGRAPYGSVPPATVGTVFGPTIATTPNPQGSALAMSWCIAFQGFFPSKSVRMPQ